jgi:C-terminal peptidase prc
MKTALWVLGLLAALSLAACGGSSGAPELLTPPTPSAEQLADQQLQVLQEIREFVAEAYIYPEFAGVEWQAQTDLLARRIEAGLSSAEFEQALDELLNLLPAGTASFSPRAERVEADFRSVPTYEGIGAFVSVRSEPTPRILLLSVIQGSPAEAAGLRAHDAVLAVDGVPVTAEEGPAVVQRVRGAAGTEVVLQVVSPDDVPRQVTVRRGRLTAQDFVRGGPLLPGVIYLLVPVAADSSLLDATVQLLETASEQDEPVRGLILDLRIAGSAADWPLSEMLALLSDGEMGTFVDRQQQTPMVIPGQDVANSQNIPVAILIGPDTSGAPELFAAALQAQGRARLVGLPTPGDVLTFQQRILADGSALAIAQSSFLTPDGEDLGLVGLSPDLLVEQDWDQVTPANDPVLSGAVDLLLREG